MYQRSYSGDSPDEKECYNSHCITVEVKFDLTCFVDGCWTDESAIEEATELAYEEFINKIKKMTFKNSISKIIGDVDDAYITMRGKTVNGRNYES